MSGAGDNTMLLERLRGIDSCAAADAQDKLKLLNGYAGGIGALTVPRRLVGRAVTVRLGLADGRPASRHLGAAAVDAAKTNSIIVVANDGRMETACWGGILSAGAKRNGVSGVVLDGGLRDIDEARALGLPVFAKGVVLRAARGRIMELDWNTPVIVAGVAVAPDDYVIADSCGVVFVAAETASDVLAAAEAIVAREAAMLKAVQAGTKMADVMGANYEAMLR